jgi:tetratricopeptide (TPR) repeat protein
MVRATRMRLGFVVLILSLLSALGGFGDDTKSSATDSALAAADELYRLRKFTEAQNAYQALLKSDPKLDSAQAGLVRSMVGRQKTDEALDTIDAALAAKPNSAILTATKGDVQFRRGEMAEAEALYHAALKLDPTEVRAHLGLSRLYGAYSLQRKAYDHIKVAHDLSPDDFAVDVAWVNMLPKAQRVLAMQSYLVSHAVAEAETKALAPYLTFLKNSADELIHPCRLSSKTDETETKLEPVFAPRASHPRGIGLSARINEQDVQLQLDTGAPGILVNSQFADRAKLTRLAAAPVMGFGDRGSQRGYRAVAEHIRIGDLEFEDCVVTVADTPPASRWSVPESFNLIGADVFERYLIDIDLAGMRLKLSPLPKRPEDKVAPTSLSSGVEEQSEEGPGGMLAEQPASDQDASAAAQTTTLPKDRYVAPDMADWTRVFRFGHMLLVPTSVNDSKPKLFLLDTGAVGSMLSVRAGREVSKVYYEEHAHLQGMSGRVEKVYTSHSAALRFGHLEQKNKDIVTVDLSSMSLASGTEISGVLGYETLLLLDVKLDYRDGLVDFEYDSKARKK